MALVTLADLVAPVTEADALAQELAIAAALGLPVTAWQPVGVARTTYVMNAQMISTYSSTVSFLAQGGYISLAALMVDANGAEVRTWMNLRGQDVYLTTRNAAQFATGPVPYTNSSVSSYPYTPNAPLHFQNTVTGATYTSLGSGTVNASSSGTVNVVADVAGAASSSGTGVVLHLVTPLAGVTINPLTVSLAGSDEEANAPYFQRCIGKLSTIAATGPANAYDFIAQSILQGVPSTTFPYFVSAKITRSRTILNVAAGIVNLYCANAAGPSSSGDVAVVQAAIDALIVPAAVTATALPATTAGATAIAYVVSVPRVFGFTPVQVNTRIADFLAIYFSLLPIGGFKTASSASAIPISEVEQVILDACPPGSAILPGSLTLNGTLNDVTIAVSDVPVLGAINGTVVPV